MIRCVALPASSGANARGYEVPQGFSLPEAPHSSWVPLATSVLGTDCKKRADERVQELGAALSVAQIPLGYSSAAVSADRPHRRPVPRDDPRFTEPG